MATTQYANSDHENKYIYFLIYYPFMCVKYKIF